MEGMPAISISILMEESPMNGPTWWRRWKSADHAEVLTHIVEAHGGLVLRTCQRILLNEADAQDAAQEVFLRLHKTLKQFDRERELLPWLYRMTVNVCHDLHRRKRPVTILEPASEPAASGPTPEERFSAEERRKLLFEALGRLSHREREAIVLRDLEGLSTAETARALGTAKATVRSQISGARAKLRETLARTMGRTT
jgi:RNA polymerase sigma-70 factor (ECF subfamily)